MQVARGITTPLGHSNHATLYERATMADANSMCVQPPTLEGEEWREVPGHPFVLASSLGRIWRGPRIDRLGRQLRFGIQKQYLSANGYYHFKIGSKNVLSHRLVAAAFCGAPNVDQDDVNHIDGCKTNNTPANLEWCRHLDNMRHSARTGRAPRGSRSGRAKLNEEAVALIRSRAESGESHAAIANDLGVQYQTVHRIVLRQSWTHVQ